MIKNNTLTPIPGVPGRPRMTERLSHATSTVRFCVIQGSMESKRTYAREVDAARYWNRMVGMIIERSKRMLE